MAADGSGRSFLPDVDTSRPNAARVYDLLLGGKNSFEVDRQLHAELLKVAPEIPNLVRENRRWLARMIETMVRDGGVDQFLDLGCGLPTTDNTHEIVQRLNPRATVVYVDNDPTVAIHGLALLADERTVHFVDADLTDPAAVLADPVVAKVLDLSRPVGVLQGLVLHHVPGQERARHAVDGYLSAMAPGSYLAMTHPINPRDGSRLAEFSAAVEDALRPAVQPSAFRTPAEVAELLEGLELLPPGLTTIADSCPTGDQSAKPTGVTRLVMAVLARK
ncbi:SAM-dependent methyltransferase [Kribbella italica]|uniref:Trans-aconitate methyltransferase n=1 Tax=Kribbella italica TaxID=1540520 RepID=A0A7W9J9T1_9ACTN|nr:trans-aconitate methyltransferase [Kribbella italica]